MNSSRSVVNKMFEAFLQKDLQASVATVSDDTIWIHHGTQKLPSLRFEGKGGVEKFFQTSFTEMTFEYYRPTNFIEMGDTLAVLGEESFLYQGATMSNKWVQIYTVSNGLIARMEEFATSTEDGNYLVVR